MPLECLNCNLRWSGPSSCKTKLIGIQFIFSIFIICFTVISSWSLAFVWSWEIMRSRLRARGIDFSSGRSGFSLLLMCMFFLLWDRSGLSAWFLLIYMFFLLWTGGISRFLLSRNVACCSGFMVIIRPSSRRRTCYLNSSCRQMTSWLDEMGWVEDLRGWKERVKWHETIWKV